MKVEGVDYSNPNKFKLKQRILLAIVPPLFAVVYRALSATWRWEIRHRDRLETMIAKDPPALFGVWHECTFPFMHVYQGRGVHSAASYSFDGEMGTRIMAIFQIGMVRGSSSRGGGLALDNLLKAAPHVPAIGLTIDGPRGPRRVAKPGIAILAARLQRPILTNALVATSAWRMHSWDRFMIPKPFARIICEFGPEIPAPATDSPEDVEATRLRVEEELNALHDRLDAEIGARAE